LKKCTDITQDPEEDVLVKCLEERFVRAQLDNECMAKEGDNEDKGKNEEDE